VLRDEMRLAFCGVGTTPVRASRAEAALAGRPPGADAMAEAGRALDADLDPPGDVQRERGAEASPGARPARAGRAPDSRLRWTRPLRFR